MRRLVLTVALAQALTQGLPAMALAQEPLFLRIRPSDPMRDGLGAGGSLTDAEIVQQARAAREEVWARSDRRARIAIASICDVCLTPDRGSAGALDERSPSAADALRYAQDVSSPPTMSSLHPRPGEP